MLEALNETADRDLGAVVLSLDARDQSEQSDLLVACELSYGFESEWGEGMVVRPLLAADPAVHPNLGAGTLDFVWEQCRNLHEDWYVQVADGRLLLKSPMADWRERRQASRDRGERPVDNQGTHRTIASMRRADRLTFASDEEVSVYQALVRKQKSLPSGVTIGIMPGRASGSQVVPSGQTSSLRTVVGSE